MECLESGWGCQGIVQCIPSFNLGPSYGDVDAQVNGGHFLDARVGLIRFCQGGISRANINPLYAYIGLSVHECAQCLIPNLPTQRVSMCSRARSHERCLPPQHKLIPPGYLVPFQNYLNGKITQ